MSAHCIQIDVRRQRKQPRFDGLAGVIHNLVRVVTMEGKPERAAGLRASLARPDNDNSLGQIRPRSKGYSV